MKLLLSVCFLTLMGAAFFHNFNTDLASLPITSKEFGVSQTLNVPIGQPVPEFPAELAGRLKRLSETGVATREDLKETMRLAARGNPDAMRQLFEIKGEEDQKKGAILIAMPVGESVAQELRKLAEQYSMALYLLKPWMEPLGIASADFREIVRRVNPTIMGTFVNENYRDHGIFREEITPRLKMLAHMGLGYGTLDLIQLMERGILRTYMGAHKGEKGGNVLRHTVAETGEALLMGIHHQLTQFEPILESNSPGNLSLEEVLEKANGVPKNRWELEWGLLFYHIKRINEGIEFGRAGYFCGCGNGRRTVRSFQLTHDPALGIETTLGLIGSAEAVRYWAQNALSHPIFKLFYWSEERLPLEDEDALHLTYTENLKQLISQSHFVLRSQGAPEIPDELYTSVTRQRKYPWLIDPKRYVSKTKILPQEWGRGLRRPIRGGMRVGILGLGSIGEPFAHRLKALGVNVIILRHDRQNPKYEELRQELGFELTDELGDIFEEADFIFSALPSTQETKGMIKAKMIRNAPKLQGIINVGRGDIFENEKEIAKAVSERGIFLGLDVLDQEMLEKEEQVFLQERYQSLIFVLPHQASNSFGFAFDAEGNIILIGVRDVMAKIMVLNMQRGLAGVPQAKLPNPIPDPEMNASKWEQVKFYL